MKLNIVFLFLLNLKLFDGTSATVQDYEASSGCSDVTPTEGQWVRRRGDGMTIGCYSTMEMWYYVCRGGEWLGDHTATCRPTSEPYPADSIEDCLDPTINENQSMRRIGDTLKVECRTTAETWYLICANGKWFGDIGTCTHSCPDPAVNADQWISRSGRNLVVRCQTSQESWHLTCWNGRWIGEIGTCSSLYCPDPTINENQWMRRTGPTLSVGCQTTYETWFLSCYNGRWIGDIGTCSSLPNIDCPDPAINENQWMRRNGPALVVGCRTTDETWYSSCSNGRWFGAFGTCSLLYSDIDCPDPTINENQWLRRTGPTLVVGCQTTYKTWYLTCSNGRWIGDIGTCSSLHCTTPSYNTDVYSITRRYDSVSVSCRESSQVWNLRCIDGQWVGIVGECVRDV